MIDTLEMLKDQLLQNHEKKLIKQMKKRGIIPTCPKCGKVLEHLNACQRLPPGEVCEDCQKKARIAEQVVAARLPPKGMAKRIMESKREVKTIITPEDYNE